MVVKNPLCKDDDTEFKKLAAIYAYAPNHATPATADTQMQRIFTWYMVKLIVLLFSWTFAELLVWTKRKKLLDKLLANVDVEPVNEGSGLDDGDPDDFLIVEEEIHVFILQDSSDNTRNVAVHEFNDDSDSK